MKVVPPAAHEPQVSIACIACKGSGLVIGPACMSDFDGSVHDIPIGSQCPFCKGTKKMAVTEVGET